MRSWVGFRQRISSRSRGVATLFGLISFLLWAANVVFSILGGVKVQQGGSYRYPFSFRFVK